MKRSREPLTAWDGHYVISLNYGALRCFAVSLLKILCFCISGVAFASQPYTLTGKVVKVADGDTITLLVDREQHRIRLASIDAPETSHGSAEPGQPFGEAASKYLASLVAGNTLTLQCFERDHYSREICDVPLQGTTANRLLVQNGFAWANQQGGGKYLRDQSLPALQAKAQADKLGLWSEPKPVPPWVWRYQCWKQKQC
jgi:endonuclease YncB( thermonuclease family)